MRWFLRIILILSVMMLVAGILIPARYREPILARVGLKVETRVPESVADAKLAVKEDDGVTPDSPLDDEPLEPVSLAEFLNTAAEPRGAAPLADTSPTELPEMASAETEAAEPSSETEDGNPAERAAVIGAATEESGSAEETVQRILDRATRSGNGEELRDRRPTRADPRVPHLLLVIVEDLNREDLGAYGQTMIRTPHLDELARRGLHLTQLAGSALGHTVERTSLWYGDVPSTPAADAKFMRLPRRSLPESLWRVGYTTLLLGDCSWASCAETPEQGGWEQWHDCEQDKPDDWREALIAGADRLLERRTDDRPVALVAVLRMNWWKDAQFADPQYATKDWNDTEKSHASAVTAIDGLIAELLTRVEASEPVRRTAMIVVGLPRGKKTRGLERFRDGVPGLNTGLPPKTRWPQAPLLAAFPGAIPPGRSVTSFCGMQDVMPTLLHMIENRNPKREGQGNSQWNEWRGAKQN